jgi:hypothetical protein
VSQIHVTLLASSIATIVAFVWLPFAADHDLPEHVRDNADCTRPVVGSLRKWCGLSGHGYLAIILANDFFPAGLSLAGVFGMRETAHEWPG